MVIYIRQKVQNRSFRSFIFTQRNHNDAVCVKWTHCKSQQIYGIVIVQSSLCKKKILWRFVKAVARFQSFTHSDDFDTRGRIANKNRIISHWSFGSAKWVNEFDIMTLFWCIVFCFTSSVMNRFESNECYYSKSWSKIDWFRCFGLDIISK